MIYSFTYVHVLISSAIQREMSCGEAHFISLDKKHFSRNSKVDRATRGQVRARARATNCTGIIIVSFRDGDATARGAKCHGQS